jgi:hypothetical protein
LRKRLSLVALGHRIRLRLDRLWLLDRGLRLEVRLRLIGQWRLLLGRRLSLLAGLGVKGLQVRLRLVWRLRLVRGLCRGRLLAGGSGLLDVLRRKGVPLRWQGRLRLRRGRPLRGRCWHGQRPYGRDVLLLRHGLLPAP